VPLWTNRYGWPGDSVDAAYSLAVDSSGNVFVMGYCGRMTNIYSYYTSYATVAYSSAGVPLWTNRFDGPGNSNDRAKAVAVDRSGNVFVTGSSWSGSGSGADYATIKYSSAGGPLLTIARTTTNTLALSWPSPAAAFNLQQNTNVASTNWTPVGYTPADDGTNRTVIIDPPEWNRFYRLFRP
jgi:hypothetical protein